VTVTGQAYTVVFDATNQPLPWGVLPLGLTFVGIGVVMWLTRDLVWSSENWFWKNPVTRTRFAGAWLAFAVIWTVLASVGSFRSVLSARSALRNGTASVVEGPVLGFHPMPYTGHDTERFTVKGVSFAYSECETCGGFNHTRSHGGPIDEGTLVRIHYDGSPRQARILRLEVRE
jgi:hypothetical protein